MFSNVVILMFNIFEKLHFEELVFLNNFFTKLNILKRAFEVMKQIRDEGYL